MKTRSTFATVVAMLMIACGDQTTPPDASDDEDTGTDAAAEICERDLDCADPGGRFCVVYRCRPGEGDARGCVDTGSPCSAGTSCDEIADECIPDSCDGDPDVDEDGHDSIACGEDDCDDNDPNRFPGNPEICDSEGHDEDCRLDTFAGPSDGDRDLDGAISNACCQQQSDGELACGTDCHDTSDAIRPSASEICNGVDDNCNGGIDEDVQRTCWVDADGDGYASVGAAEVLGCGDCPTATTDRRPIVGAIDCDDGNEVRYPGAEEQCDRFDFDCTSDTDIELAEDEDDDGHAPLAALCSGGFPRDDCYDLNAEVYPGQEGWFGVHRGDGSFDYDCDGDRLQEYPRRDGECILTGGNCSSAVVCTLVPGYTTSTTLPDCGETGGTWITACECGSPTYCRPSSTEPHQQRCH